MLYLLKKRSFGAMTLSQFLGAFNDNAFKTVVMLLVVAATQGTGREWVESSRFAAYGQGLPVSLFALPFVVFGPITGALADRLSKVSIIRFANLMEVAVMAIAASAFALQNYDVLMFTVFLMGTQSAIFGPAKYGVIKELVGAEELSRGNALIQSTTMIAILAGQGLAGWLSDTFGDKLWVAGFSYVGFAIAGWLVSLRIEKVPAADPTRVVSWNPLKEFIGHWRATDGNKHLILSIIASAFFYMMAAGFISMVLAYGRWLGLSDTATTMLNAATGIGIVVGATIAGRISRDRIEGGLIPLGLLGMAASVLIIQIDPRSVWLARGALFAMGVSSGLFTIPIRSLIQGLPREEKRGSVQGLAETMDFIGIFLAGPFVWLLARHLEMTPPQMFLVGGALIAAFAIATLVITAEYFVRVVILVLTNTIYRVNSRGAEHLPEHSGALLVCNHVSFLDAVLVASTSSRPVRFLMFRDLFDLPMVGWFARRMGAIPISSRDGREAKEEALAAAADAAANGDLVCIFAEGAITRTGSLLGFASGLERIAARADVPIIPISLDRLWGSIFSFHGGRFFWKRPQRLPYPVDIEIGAPLPPSTSAPEVRVAIQELTADTRRRRRGRRGSLAWRFLYSAKRFGRRPAIVDSTGTRMHYRRLLIGSLALRFVLQRRLGQEERVALLLPPSAGGALANIALALCGKASVNLNYTLSNEALAGPLERAGVRQVITSARFLKALERRSPLPKEQTLYLEDLAKEVTGMDKFSAFLLTLLPAAWLAHLVAPQRSADEVATVIFSSGSTGEPKGVQLTHGNVLSNVQSVLQVFRFGPGDALLGILPFFHSFGYTVTLWAGLLSGSKAVYHANPLEAKRVGELCGEEQVTVMVATPTFYQSYLRRCPAEQFAHVRFAMCGAQKLPQRLADEWQAKTGSVLMEGYGATELAPVVSCNLPDPPGLSPRHRAHQPGTVGRPLPGVVVRAVHIEDGTPLAPGEEGLLLVKGPNVMLGYLGQPEATSAVMRDGWYVTGDVGRVEPDGFVVLTDRLSRFSKIGGEMVPHGRIEEELNTILAEASPNDEGELAVTAVEDERRGEELVVLHTALAIETDVLVQGLAGSELPALFRPKPTNYVRVDEIPKLGTGKVDLKALKLLAAERLTART